MLRHIKPGMLVFSVLYILLGLLLLLAPQAVADVFCIALGLLVVSVSYTHLTLPTTSRV